MDGSILNSRERFLAVMQFKPGIRTLRWEFAYWNATIDRWYREGLPRSPFSPPPGLESGGSHYGEGLPFPYYIGLFRSRDVDVHDYFHLDDGAGNVPMNWRFYPPLKEKILEEDDVSVLMVNVDGVTLRYKKESDSVPQFLAWPVFDRKSWEQTKEERYSLNDVLARLPGHWEINASSYSNRDYPLGLRMEGFFATPRELMGVQHQLMMYYDDPQLMHDINQHLEKLWLAMAEEIVARVELDFVHTWEDMAYKNGPLISPRMFNEFISPYYKKLTGFLKAQKVKYIFADSDGDCSKLIPSFLDAGVNGLFPFESQSGMDVVKIRKQYPQLLIQGGLDKICIAQGEKAIDAELDQKLPYMLSQGGYIPFMDHLAPPDISWKDFVYYREKVNAYVEKYFPS